MYSNIHFCPQILIFVLPLWATVCNGYDTNRDNMKCNCSNLDESSFRIYAKEVCLGLFIVIELHRKSQIHLAMDIYFQYNPK